MKFAITGGQGFLGFHTRALIRSRDGDAECIRLGASFSRSEAAIKASNVQRFIHLAGVNRGTSEEVYEGNVLLATQAALALRSAVRPPPEVVFANSIQAGNGSVYGTAKAEAATILRAAAEDVGAKFTDLGLPNLFGEHGRPSYNSVIATFCHMLQKGHIPEVQDDKALVLLHAQRAAEFLVGVTPPESLMTATTQRTVSEVLDELGQIAETYRFGDIPSIESEFGLELFNTYRSFRPASELPFALSRHQDARGSFFEACRAYGGGGQTSFSTTVPAVTRGQHFHRRKVERFVVLAGRAEISMRRLFTNEIQKFEVDGDSPVAIDMPTLWTHNITNIDNRDLYTMFWTNEVFDPSAPDTFAEEV